VTHYLGYVVTGVAVIAAYMAYYVFKHASENGGFFLSQRSHERFHFVPCKHCDGCGVTLLGEIIPREYRSFLSTKDGLLINGKIANTMTCTECLGMCGHYVSDTGEKRPVVQDRKTGDVWNQL
jgi:hypothetical protein